MAVNESVYSFKVGNFFFFFFLLQFLIYLKIDIWVKII